MRGGDKIAASTILKERRKDPGWKVITGCIHMINIFVMYIQ